MSYSKHCTGEVYWGMSKRPSKCGVYRGGRKILCDPCNTVAEMRYPQGWTGYPGDTCGHGVYVGGCGVDWMCGRCEMGED